MLNWATIGEEKFNRAVEMLIVRTVGADDPGLVATAVDGRGGDGGIDIDVRVKKTGQLVTIYQLKHFPEGFSGAWAKARKPQITKSFKSAKEHDPAKWALVIPRNFAPKERSFVNSLRSKSARPRIERVGATELDNMLSRFPEIEDYINRDANVAALKEVGRQSALLAKAGDLAAEMDQLKKRIDARSIYWGTNFGQIGDHQFEELVPLRPDSAEREPLSITFTADFTGDKALGEEFRRALDYGAFNRVHLPGSVVTQFERLGPEWFAGIRDVLGIDLTPVEREVDLPIKVVLRSASGSVLAQPKCRRATITSGARGAQLRLFVVDGIEFVLRFERGHGAAELTYEVNLQGRSGTAAKRALTFLTALARASEIGLRIGSLPPLPMQFNDTSAPPPLPLVEFADDLAAIEAELGVEFELPEHSPALSERVWIRVIRRVLEGKACYAPGSEDLNFTVTPPLTVEGEHLLEDEDLNVGMEVDGFTWEILGQETDIGDVMFVVQNAHAIDGTAHLAALKTAGAEPRIVSFRSRRPGGGVVIFDRGRRPSDGPLVVERWGITGVLEHKSFERPAAGSA